MKNYITEFVLVVVMAVLSVNTVLIPGCCEDPAPQPSSAPVYDPPEYSNVKVLYVNVEGTGNSGWCVITYQLDSNIVLTFRRNLYPDCNRVQLGVLCDLQWNESDQYFYQIVKSVPSTAAVER